uniref:Protein phosphatase 1 regulatory subunit 7 n=1 Tax=Strongyloides venezuelensis TaxID=75913 RepID=A0A0K0F6B8_STRVS
MRIPKGVKVPLLLRLRSRFPLLNSFNKPSIGTVAVVGVVILTSLGLYEVIVQPKLNEDYYKQSQKEKRALLHGTREDFSQGLRPWSDPKSWKKMSENEEKKDVQYIEFELNEPVNLNEVDEGEEMIELINNRLKVFPDVSRFHSLKYLSLRQNLLVEIPELDIPNLETLDLYDNQITAIKGLDKLTKLRVLDLSQNRIIKIEGLQNLVNLEELFLTYNKIKQIEGLENNIKLTQLELGCNRISKIENISHLTCMKKLHLGKNKIKVMEGFETMTQLEILGLAANRITKIENLTTLTNLQELHISEQGIESLDGLENVTSIELLDLSKNMISKISNIELLTNLTDLYLNDNKIEDVQSLNNLGKLKKLETLYLERNPVQTNDPANYRRKVILSIPSLSQLDATACRV